MATIQITHVVEAARTKWSLERSPFSGYSSVLPAFSDIIPQKFICKDAYVRQPEHEQKPAHQPGILEGCCGADKAKTLPTPPENLPPKPLPSLEGLLLGADQAKTLAQTRRHYQLLGGGGEEEEENEAEEGDEEGNLIKYPGGGGKII